MRHIVLKLIEIDISEPGFLSMEKLGKNQNDEHTNI